MKKSTLSFLCRQASIIIITAIILMLSITFLAWTEHKQSDFSTGKSWWAVSFVEPLPTSDNLAISIENYSDANIFTYEITTDTGIIDTGEITVPRGAKKTLSLPPKAAQNKITVSIKNGDDERLLYK